MGVDDQEDVEQFLVNALEVLGNWSVHDDDEGHLFYFNRATKVSSWQVPQEFHGRDGEFMMKLMLQHALSRSGVWTAHDAGNGTIYYFNEKTRESVWECPPEWGMEPPPSSPTKPSGVADETEPPKDQSNKKKRAKKDKKPKRKQVSDDVQREPAQDDDDDDDEEEEEPLTPEELQELERKQEQRKKVTEQFRQMLRDKKIMPFTKWSVALPRIATDPRFIAVQMWVPLSSPLCTTTKQQLTHVYLTEVWTNDVLSLTIS